MSFSLLLLIVATLVYLTGAAIAFRTAFREGPRALWCLFGAALAYMAFNIDFIASHEAIAEEWFHNLVRLGGAVLLTAATIGARGLMLSMRETEARHERTEEELQKNLKVLSFHFENTPLAVLEWDSDFRIARWSPQAEEVFGWSAAEVIGKHPSEFPFVHEEDADKVNGIMEGLLNGQQKRNLSSNRNRTKSGDVVHCVWYNSALLDEDGRLLSIFSLIQEVTARRMAERELGEARETLERRVEERTAALEKEIAERKRALEALALSEHTFRQSLQHAPIGIALLAPDGRWLEVNDAVCRLFGYTREDLMSRTFQDITHPEDLENDLENVKQVLDGTISTYQMEKRYIHRDGHIVWARLSVSLARSSDGEPLHFISHIEDIGESKASEEQRLAAARDLERSHADLEKRNREITLFKEMGDQLQVCLSVSEASEVIRHYGTAILPRLSGSLYLLSASKTTLESVCRWGPVEPGEPMFHPEDCWALRRSKDHHVVPGTAALRCRHSRADPRLEEFCVSLNAQGQSLGLLHVYAESAPDQEPLIGEERTRTLNSLAEHVALVFANLRLREILHNQSVRDPLTGMFNRRYLEESLERELRSAERHKRAVTLIMLDIDHFKKFNDDYGHAAGDAVLRVVGAKLRQLVRREDIPCRYGGEEFVLILPEAKLSDGLVRAEDIRDAIGSLSVDHEGQALRALTVSIGVAATPEHGFDMNVLMRAADKALYKAKHEGRNRVVVAPQPDSGVQLPAS